MAETSSLHQLQFWQMNASTLQVSCASEGDVTITVGETEVLCQSAGQQVGCCKWTDTSLGEFLQMSSCVVCTTHYYHTHKWLDYDCIIRSNLMRYTKIFILKDSGRQVKQWWRQLQVCWLVLQIQQHSEKQYSSVGGNMCNHYAHIKLVTISFIHLLLIVDTHSLAFTSIATDTSTRPS